MMLRTPLPILIVGAGGQLGRELLRLPWPERLTPVPLRRADLDLADAEEVAGIASRLRPAMIVNLAAYSNVEAAEHDADQAYRVNAEAPRLLARSCAALGIPFLHVSSDYVFDGRQSRPYRETDIAAPLNVYGRTKAAADDAIACEAGHYMIIRTSWLYSAQPGNFVTRILAAARTRPVLRVVDDQIGSPTYAPDLARAILAMLIPCLDKAPESRGLINYAGGGSASWHDLAVAVVAGGGAAGLPAVPVERIASVEYPSCVQRPAYSVLDCTLAATQLGLAVPSWCDSLQACLADLYR